MTKKFIIVTLTIIFFINTLAVGSISNSITNAPSAPTLNDLVLQNNAVELSWQAPFSNGGNTIIGYRVYRASSENSTFELIGVTSSLSFRDSSFSKSLDYYYVVRAYNVDGESVDSNMQAIGIVLQHNSLLGTIIFYLPYVLLLFLIVVLAIVGYVYFEYRKNSVNNSSTNQSFGNFFKKNFISKQKRTNKTISSETVDSALAKIDEILQENQSDS